MSKRDDWMNDGGLMGGNLAMRFVAVALILGFGLMGEMPGGRHAAFEPHVFAHTDAGEVSEQPPTF